MLKSILIGTAVLAVAIPAITTTYADKSDRLLGGEEFRGPDVVAWYTGGSGLDMQLYGQENGINAFAFGTTSCNFGDMEANWGAAGNTSYPVIAQTCYRLKNGRFEQIGTAWLKHSFCAVSEPGCGNCQATPCDTLGIGCADTYWAGLNADATAPRSEINAFTGQYEYPFTIYPTGSSSMRGKLQIREVDIEPASGTNPDDPTQDALYFIEAQYVSEDDAEWNNQDNNASYKWIRFSSTTSAVGLSSTQVEMPAIYAWKFFDDEVDLHPVRVPDEGLLHIGSRVYDNGDGTWRYEFAVHNLNSDRSINSFTVPLGDCVSISDVGFHDIDLHSGEQFESSDWGVTIDADTVTWQTSSYETNIWSNAIRWGSTFNFWFTANQGPTDGELSLGIFKPGGVPSVHHSTSIPGCEIGCPADIDGNGAVNVSDLLNLIAVWGDCDACPQDINGSGSVDVSDLLELIASWGDC
jgi:hypothetical protein